MARSKTIHRCGECAATFPRWAGRCDRCGAWNSLREEPVGARGTPTAAPVVLSDVDPSAGAPVASGLDEIDRVLGGGLVPGSVTLLGGEPGVGKSTLLLQLLAAFASSGRRALLVAAEESVEQVRRRALRLGDAAGAVAVLATTSLPAALDAAIADRPDLLVVDSVQTVHDPEVLGTGGSVTQVRECAARLVAFAKSHGTAVVLVSHLTKDGSLAGPRVLEHLVDTVCHLEGDRHHALRLLSVTKHRFGPAGELGLFTMAECGLEALDDPSGFLLADRCTGVAGSIVVPVLEGRRPFLLELQALVVSSALPSPRRTAQGVAPGRLALVLAVLERRAGWSLADRDVYASFVGGVRVAEPAADLGLALALASAAAGVPLGEDLVACGEVGLAGELRQVPQTEQRLAEAARRGFRRAIVPRSSPEAPRGMRLVRATTIAEAVAALGCGSERLAVA